MGVGVFIVPTDAKGIAIKGYETQDGSRAADIKLNNVEVSAESVIGNVEDGWAHGASS